MSKDVKKLRSANERRVFAFSLVVLGTLFALLIWFRPDGLLVIACVSAIAWATAMLFNRDEPVGRRWKGILIPLLASALCGLTYLVESRAVIALGAGAVLALLGVMIWFRERFAARFYENWLLLFLPLAWSVSTLLLVLVYYFVLTPIGLAMRLVGRDPMNRKFDREAASYWVKRDQGTESDRYFRQF
jgi:hypothetical protein